MTVKNKENALKILEEHYKVAKEQKDAWNFFLNIAEYIRFVQNNSQFTEAIRKLQEQQKMAYEIFNKVDKKAIQELQKASKTVIDAVKRLNINLEPINNEIKSLQAYNAGGILSSLPKAHALNQRLFNIARPLKENGFENAIQRFINEQKNLTFSPTLTLRDRAQEDLDIKKETEIWGAWEEFPFIERIVFDEINLEKEFERESQNDSMKRWALMNFIGARTELGNMRIRKKDDSELVFFKISDFINKLDRIHKYFLTELLLDEEEKPQKFNFDNEKSTLTIKNIPIKIQKLSDQYYTLKAIIDEDLDIVNECFFSQIAEAKVYLAEHIESGFSDKKFYNAIYQINQKITKETGIKNYFMTTQQSFRINPDYISKNIT